MKYTTLLLFFLLGCKANGIKADLPEEQYKKFMSQNLKKQQHVYGVDGGDCGGELLYFYQSDNTSNAFINTWDCADYGLSRIEYFFTSGYIQLIRKLEIPQPQDSGFLVTDTLFTTDVDKIKVYTRKKTTQNVNDTTMKSLPYSYVGSQDTAFIERLLIELKEAKIRKE